MLDVNSLLNGSSHSNRRVENRHQHLILHLMTLRKTFALQSSALLFGKNNNFLSIPNTGHEKELAVIR